VSVRRRGSEGIGHYVVLKRPGYIYFGSNHVYTVGHCDHCESCPARSRSFRLYSSLSLITPWWSASRSVTCWSCTTPMRTMHARVVDARATAPLFARILACASTDVTGLHARPRSPEAR
jgi:hypothetical protein